MSKYQYPVKLLFTAAKVTCKGFNQSQIIATGEMTTWLICCLSYQLSSSGPCHISDKWEMEKKSILYMCQRHQFTKSAMNAKEARNAKMCPRVPWMPRMLEVPSLSKIAMNGKGSRGAKVNLRINIMKICRAWLTQRSILLNLKLGNVQIERMRKSCYSYLWICFVNSSLQLLMLTWA